MWKFIKREFSVGGLVFETGLTPKIPANYAETK